MDELELGDGRYERLNLSKYDTPLDSIGPFQDPNISKRGASLGGKTAEHADARRINDRSCSISA
jgi:hypothetical protein